MIGNVAATPIAPAFVILPWVWLVGAAEIVMSTDPSNEVPLMFLAVVNLAAELAVLALPERAAVIVVAEKLPLASRATIALAVLALVAVVAELETLPAVESVASFVSTIAAAALMSAFTITPAAIAVGIVMATEPSKFCAVPVTSPLTLIALGVASLVAVAALPVQEAEEPEALPVKFAVIVPAEKLPEASR
jgi:hypothetical protein